MGPSPALLAAQVTAIAVFGAAGIAWPRRGRGWSRDTAVNLVTGLALALLKALVMAGLLERLGPGRLPFDRLPLAAQVGIGFLLLDACRWALHLAHHRVPLLWSFHRVHHSPRELDATAGLRMHVVDLVQLSLLPALLFSVLLDTSGSPSWLLPAILTPGVVFDAFEHANLRIDPKRPFWRAWDRLFNNPHFHAWHHTSEGHLCDGNYGNALTIWDRLFGTCVSRDELPAAFGLDEGGRLRNDPVSLQLLRLDARASADARAKATP